MAWEGKVGGGAARKVGIEGQGGALRVTLGDKTVDVVATELQPGLWLLNAQGRIFEAGVTPDGEKLQVSLHGRVYTVDIGDPRRRALSGSGGRASAVTEVSSPMPGKVISVLVAVGDTVREGQGLVVVEAMKMENEYKAPRAGKVAWIGVQAGQTLEAGARLVRLEPLPAEA